VAPSVSRKLFGLLTTGDVYERPLCGMGELDGEPFPRTSVEALLTGSKKQRLPALYAQAREIHGGNGPSPDGGDR